MLLEFAPEREVPAALAEPLPEALAEPPPKPPPLFDPAENCGVGWTATGPRLATCVFKCRRLSTDPRAMPIPAEPLLTITRDGIAPTCTVGVGRGGPVHVG